MPRNLTSEFVLALQEGYLYPCFFVSLMLASGPIYLCTAYQPQYLNGITYPGVGKALDISTIEDGSTVQARGIALTLSGIDPQLLPDVLDQFLVGQPVTIHFGLFGGQGLSLVSTTPIAWSGRTDQPTINVDATTASITINCESLLQDMNTPLPYRYTQQTQQDFYPGDQGFSLVNAIQQVPIYWNQTPNSDGNP